MTTSSASDGALFSSKERDAETGLDYFGARYMSSAQGRFTSPDLLGGNLANPQSLNRYSYALNNPLRFTDPTGMYVCADGKDGACTSDQDKAFEAALAKLRTSNIGAVARGAAAYGALGDKNGVTIGFADLGKKSEGGDTVSILGGSADGKLQAQSAVTIDSNARGTALNNAIAHEGTHVADAQDVVSSISLLNSTDYKIGQVITRYQTEQNAYRVTDLLLKSSNETFKYDCGFSTCSLGAGVIPGQLPGIIDNILAHSPLYRDKGKPLSPGNQGGLIVNGLVVPH